MAKQNTYVGTLIRGMAQIEDALRQNGGRGNGLKALLESSPHLPENVKKDIGKLISLRNQVAHSHIELDEDDVEYAKKKVRKILQHFGTNFKGDWKLKEVKKNEAVEYFEKQKKEFKNNYEKNIKYWVNVIECLFPKLLDIELNDHLNVLENSLKRCPPIKPVEPAQPEYSSGIRERKRLQKKYKDLYELDIQLNNLYKEVEVINRKCREKYNKELEEYQQKLKQYNERLNEYNKSKNRKLQSLDEIKKTYNDFNTAKLNIDFLLREEIRIFKGLNSSSFILIDIFEKNMVFINNYEKLNINSTLRLFLYQLKEHRKKYFNFPTLDPNAYSEQEIEYLFEHHKPRGVKWRR